MDVRQLEAFIAVADTLHFGRAAERLHVAPAPVTRLIQALESDLGVELFIRSTRSVTLTHIGEQLLEPVKVALSAIGEVRAKAMSLESGNVGTVNLEFSGVATYQFIAALFYSMRAEHPGIQLSLSSSPFSRRLLSRLLNDEADIVLGRWDLIPPGVESIVLQEDRLAMAFHPGHALSALKEIQFAQLREETFVALPYEGGALTSDRLWRLGYLNGFSIDKVVFAPDTQTCVALVAAGVGCHLTMASVQEVVSPQDVVIVPLADGDLRSVPTVDLRAAWKPDSTNPAVKIVATRLRKFASI